MRAYTGTKELEACVQALAQEQRRVCESVAGSTLSLSRLRQRLAVTYRYFLALGRHHPSDSVKLNSDANKQLLHTITVPNKRLL